MAGCRGVHATTLQVPNMLTTSSIIAATGTDSATSRLGAPVAVLIGAERGYTAGSASSTDHTTLTVGALNAPDIRCLAGRAARPPALTADVRRRPDIPEVGRHLGLTPMGSEVQSWRLEGRLEPVSRNVTGDRAVAAELAEPTTRSQPETAAETTGLSGLGAHTTTTLGE